MGHLVLVLGGQKSGKSSYAAQLAVSTDAPVVVIAPAVVRDEELGQRVARHRADRPPGWRTVETFDLPTALRDAPDGSTVLIDALDTWLTETLSELGVDLAEQGPSAALRASAEAQVRSRMLAALTAVRGRSGLTVVIAGQPGLGPHAMGRGARVYVDVHGLAVQTVSGAADEAILMVAGRPVALGSPAAPTVPASLRPRPRDEPRRRRGRPRRPGDTRAR